MGMPASDVQREVGQHLAQYGLRVGDRAARSPRQETIRSNEVGATLANAEAIKKLPVDIGGVARYRWIYQGS